MALVMLREQHDLLEAAFLNFAVAHTANKQITLAYCKEVFSLHTDGIKKHLCI